MSNMICRCGHSMVQSGSEIDTSFGKCVKRVKFVCPHCGNVAFLDPEKWNL